MLILKNKKIVMHIPKTGGKALKNFIKSIPDIENLVEYVTAHRPLVFLEQPSFDYARNYEKVALIREPISWWNSWFNYNLPFKYTCALTQIVVFKGNYQKRKLDINTSIIDGLDITDFFKRYDISKLKKELIETPRHSHLLNFLTRIDDLTPDYFNHESIYQFYINRMIDETVKVFRYEDQFEEFLEYIELPKPPRFNVTKYKVFMDFKTEKIVKEKERIIYEKYYPELL